ncbi:MAG: NADPH-dependent 7-cyano-7-deazaguanine reductase QueF [Chlorobi bacterium]|nr:NADPH-dependent 7-cyano-7-deazaguanine reductase QueF [Chlorobiota bacterium]
MQVERLETFPNPNPGRKFTITHVNPEFTSVCPITGLPDFGVMTVKYVPDEKCLELKALKYYYLEFRDKGIFYEAVSNQILEELVEACDPLEMEVVSEWGTRGGMHSIISVKHTKADKK